MEDEARAFRDALDRRLAGVDAVRAWAVLAEIGALGIAVPEELGGFGLGHGDAAAVVGALGAAGLVTPYLETAILAPLLLAADRTAAGDTVLRAIAGGATVAFAGLDPRLRADVSATPVTDGWRLDGDARLVLDGADAEHLLVAARTERYAPALLLADRTQPGVIARPYPTIDGRRAADLRFLAADATLVSDDAETILAEAGDAALAFLAVEAAALMRRLVEDTTAYLKGREQFGQPLARFQVLQHRLVDMHIAARRTAAIAARAVGALGGHWAERARLASAAKATAAEAGRFVGQQAVQLHGGMGMTEELPAGRLFKRLTAIEHELGSAADHRARFARMAAQAVG